jgi:hypothetical protein
MYRVPCTSKALHNIIPKFTVFCKSDGRTLFVGHWLFSYLVVWFRWKHKIDSHYLPADLDGGSQEFIFKPACVTVYPLRILVGLPAAHSGGRQQSGRPPVSFQDFAFVE